MSWFHLMTSKMREKCSRWLDYWDEVMDEANSLDPWRDSSFGDIRAKKKEGIGLFDLTILHLRDHGYYARVYRNGHLLVVFDSWIKYKLHNRADAIGFEVGWNSTQTVYVTPADEAEIVWCFGFATKNSLHARDFAYPRIVGNVKDPFCIDRILETVNDHYGFK